MGHSAMKKLQAKLQSEQTKAAGLVALSIGLTFVWFLPWLGFYWDDWLVVFHVQTGRYADLVQLYAFDRPLSAWTALLSGPILGVAPLAWQLFTLLLRGAAAYLLYRILEVLFPRHTQFSLWTAMLFAVYPAYRLQPIAVAYSQHWISYAAFFLSILFMLRAFQQEQGRWRNTLLALLLAFTHLATLEYFAGLELLRPFALALLVSRDQGSWQERGRKLILTWAPYLLLLAGSAVWRLFLLEFPVEPHPPVLLTGLRDQPLGTLIELSQTALSSFVAVLVSGWLRAFTSGTDALFWVSLLGALMAGTLLLGASRSWEAQPDSAQGPNYLGLALVGLIAVGAGLAPAWVIGESPVQAGYNERFALPAMLGAALFFVGTGFHFIRSARSRSVLLAALFVVALVVHIRAADDFRQDWRQQSDYFQQVAWRAPAIAPNTAFIAYGRLTEFMPVSSSSAALNSLYSQSRESEFSDYWYFDLGRTRHVRKLEREEALSSNYRGMLFEADGPGAVLYFYQPKDACLWLLSERDTINPYLPDEVRAFAAYSNPERVLAGEDNLNGRAIFDLTPQDSWCYYYQQSARLHQRGFWDKVIATQAKAEDKGLAPSNALELLPLLEAYIQTEDWEAAGSLSAHIEATDERNGVMLCQQWLSLEEVWSVSEAGLQAWQGVDQQTECR